MHLNVFAGDSHRAKSSSNGREQMQPGQDRACPVLGCWHLGWGVGNADVWLVKTAFLAKRGVIPLAAFTPCSFLYLLSAFLGLPRDASLDGCAQGLGEGLCFSLGRAQGEMGKSLGPGESLAGQRDEAGQGLPPSARAKGKGRT